MAVGRRAFNVSAAGRIAMSGRRRRRRQLDAVRRYAAGYDALADEESLAYVRALLERDRRIHDLREKYLVEYAKVLPAGKAARVIHITRRLGLASQNKLAEAIPLVR